MRNANIFVGTIILLIASSCSTYTKTTGAAQLKGHYWKLVEVNGKSLTDAQLAREPFIIFSDLDSRVSGNSSCNHFFWQLHVGR